MLYQTPTYAGVPHNHFHTKPHNSALQRFYFYRSTKSHDNSNSSGLSSVTWRHRRTSTELTESLILDDWSTIIQSASTLHTSLLIRLYLNTAATRYILSAKHSAWARQSHSYCTRRCVDNDVMQPFTDDCSWINHAGNVSFLPFHTAHRQIPQHIVSTTEAV